MVKVVEADIVIIGGGIAGLWMLNRLRDLGLTCILFEASALGGGQTFKSQGIIHGGVKYALQGTVTNAAQTIADMPRVWKSCLAGNGDIDLTNVPILASEQHLWSTSKLTAKLAGFFAGMALNNSVKSIERSDYPAIFQHPQFKGEVFALDEMVLDVPSLVCQLAKPHQDALFKMMAFDESSIHVDAQTGGVEALEIQTIAGETVRVVAQRFVFAAGAGNEMILRKLQEPNVAMQRRPLHMLLVKTGFDLPLYAHCLGLGTVPRLTITTHKTYDGQSVWYVGGQIAEEGIGRSSEAQIQVARNELQNVFPWLDFRAAKFTSFMIDRAEPMQLNGQRPDGVFAKTIGNAVIAWPTKLALVPKLADEVVQLLRKDQVKHALYDTHYLFSWPMPPFARPVWDEMLC